MQMEQSLKFINKVNEEEAKEAFHVLASSLIFDSSYNTKAELHNKSIFISFLSTILEEALRNNVVKSKQERLKLIKLLDKLKQQKEAVEFAKGNEVNLQIAAERLGKKAQSAFSNPNIAE